MTHTERRAQALIPNPGLNPDHKKAWAQKFAPKRSNLPDKPGRRRHHGCGVGAYGLQGRDKSARWVPDETDSGPGLSARLLRYFIRSARSWSRGMPPNGMKLPGTFSAGF